MALIENQTSRDAIITCIKGEGAILKFWALPLTSVDNITALENHFMRVGNDIAKSDMFMSSNQIPPGFKGAVYSKIKKQWCRGKLKCVISSNEIVVQLLDYGNEEQLSVSDVRGLDESCFKLSPQSIECILADVLPTSEKWSPDAVRFCEQQLLFQKVSCFVVSQFLTTPVIRIAKNGEKEPFVQRLINNGLAYIKTEAPQQAQPPVRTVQNFKMNTLDPNTTHLVRISFIETPYKFYVQLAAAEVELKKMMDEIKVHTSKENTIMINPPHVNTPCLATFGGKHVFYRAVVTSIMHNQYYLLSVDYGCSEVKDHKELRPIPPRYLALPAQAICCSLPKGDVNVEDFARIVKCGLVECHVLGLSDERHVVRLAPHVQEHIMQRPFPSAVKPQILSYQCQKLSPNAAYDVTISFTNDVSEFYFQLNHFKEQLEELTNILNSGCEFQPLSLVDCVPNLPVCVKFSEDHVWYRAQIVKVNHEHDIEVFFVDFGNYDNSSIRDVRRMLPELMPLPMQAHKCCLYGVDLPLDSTEKDEMFDQFEELTSGQSLIAHVHMLTDEQTYAVTLKDRNASVSINEKLQSKPSTIAMVPVCKIEPLYITCFESPSYFFAQFEKLSSKKLEEMQNEINEVYSNARNTSFKPKVGSFVCAKYKMDSQFYRARVENVVAIDCDVIFIDYGNKETISIYDIHPLNKKFLSYPQFGIECGLETFPPATPVDKLKSLMLENSVQAHMIKEDKKKWLIKLTEDFTGNVAILELLRQHEAVIPRSIHGAGLRGFQESAIKREESPYPVQSDIHPSRNSYQNAVVVNTVRPRTEPPFNRNNRAFSPPLREERNDSQTYKMSFDITSIPPKAFRNVCVTHVVSPSEFYCQIEEESSKLQALMKSIEDVYVNMNDDEMKLDSLVVDSPCCAMYQEDEGWYRAQIKQISPNSCTVYFIDYGNTDVVPISKVKALQKEFFSLPAQAICCKSHNVSPKSGAWSDSDIEAFMEMTFDKSFVAQFFGSDNNDMYSVNLVPIGKIQEEALNLEFVSLGHGRLEDASKLPVSNNKMAVLNNNNTTSWKSQTTETTKPIKPLHTHIPASNITLQMPVVKLGSLEDVTVTYGLNPGEVFCQLKSFERDFKKMMFDLQEYYNKISSEQAMIDRPHQGMICICQFFMDSAWYRGEITNVDRNSLVISYVDYGNSETVDRNKVRSITQSFTKLPIQGIKCRLKGIKPPGKAWPSDQNISKYFEGEAQCRFISKEEDSFVVDLICNRENVAERLVKDRLASSDAPVKVQELPSVTSKALKPHLMQPSLERETLFVSGQLLSVTVSFIESPFKFWCQLVDESEILEQLKADIESQYSEAGTHPIDADSLSPGTYCMAKYSADEAWYRAQVKSCTSGEYEVFFIDYGNSEVTALSEIAAILPQFLKASPLCFECRLPRASADSKKAEEFQAISDEAEEITAKVESVTNGVYILTLLIEKDGEEVNVSDLLFGDEEIGTIPIEEAPKFLPPDVPLGSQEGYVTVVNTPHDFYIQLATVEERLAELSSELSEMCEAATEAENVVQTPCIGSACCAKFSEDNNWYRAEIYDLQETTADVLFVDYGNVSSVPKNSLKILDGKLLDIPPYAIRCKLNGITSPTDQWSDAAVESFQDMVLECQLGVTFISKDIPATVNLSKEDKDVAQSLVDLELAIIDTCPETEEAYADDHLTAVEDQLHSLPFDQNYPQRKLSSSKLSVKFSYVDSYDKFFVMPQELTTELDTVMKTLEILYSPSVDGAEDSSDRAKTSVPEVLEEPTTSMACVAKYSEDEAWYRAVITDIEGDNIYVSFVDYGNSEVSSLKNLRPLTPELIKIPPIAMECKLYAIQANEGKEAEITAKLEEYFMDEVSFDMEIFKLNEPYEVRLYQNDEDLAEMLCQKGLATEVIPPLENVKLVENLNDNVKENLKTAFVEPPEDVSASVPVRSYAEKSELLVSVKYWEVENDTIVVYAVPSEIDDKLSNFQEKLQTVYNESEIKLAKINCSDYCVAKYMEDENWYRAQITSVDGDDIKVMFIDYGNSETVNSVHISELCSEFINEPQFSIKFCLSGFRVAEGKHDDLQSKMDECLYEEPILVKLCKYLCNVPSTCVADIMCGEVDIVKELLANKLVSPQYIVNAQFGNKFEATVESIVEDIFYLLPVQLVQERINLQNYLQEVCCDESASIDEINSESLYVGKIDNQWLRVSISSINNASNCAFVKCIDYATEAEIELSKLALLPEELWHRPLLLHQCVVTNIEDTPSIINSKDMNKISECTFICEIEEPHPLKFPFKVKLFKKDQSDISKTSEIQPAEIENEDLDNRTSELTEVCEEAITAEEVNVEAKVPLSVETEESNEPLKNADGTTNTEGTQPIIEPTSSDVEVGEIRDPEDSQSDVFDAISVEEQKDSLSDVYNATSVGNKEKALQEDSQLDVGNAIPIEEQEGSQSDVCNAIPVGNKEALQKDSQSDICNAIPIEEQEETLQQNSQSDLCNAIPIEEQEEALKEDSQSDVSNAVPVEKQDTLQEDPQSGVCNAVPVKKEEEALQEDSQSDICNTVPVEKKEALQEGSQSVLCNAILIGKKEETLQEAAYKAKVDDDDFKHSINEELSLEPESSETDSVVQESVGEMGGQFSETEIFSISSGLSDTGSPVKPSRLAPDDLVLSSDNMPESKIDLFAFATSLESSDNITKDSSSVQTSETDNSSIEPSEKCDASIDNDLQSDSSPKYNTSVLQELDEMEDYRVESSELEIPVTNHSVEDNEWDERPECDIKQDSQQAELENSESVGVQGLLEGEEPEKEEYNETKESEVEMKTCDTESAADLKIEEVSHAESDLTEESYSDVLMDASQQQLSGKVDAYVSDLVISNGSVILTVIPYELHMKLVSTLGETFQSIYSKKESGLKHSSVSDLCAVHSDDKWFRGKILGLDGDRLNLLLIDYGITKTVDKSSAVDLEPAHKKIPPYAMQCKLASVHCTPEKSERVKDFLFDLLANVQSTGKDVSIEIVETGNPQQVNLFLVGQNVLFELLSQNIVTQTLPRPSVNPGKHSAKASFTNINDGKFQLYATLADHLDDLKKLQNSMNSSYPLNVEKTSAVESGVYAVLHKGSWLRGKAISLEDELQLFLVDSGEMISVGSDLYPLLPEHCIQPPFAIPCQVPGKIVGTDDVLSALRDIFTIHEFLIYVDADSESNDLTAKVMDEEMIEKIKSASHLGQSGVNDTETT